MYIITVGLVIFLGGFVWGYRVGCGAGESYGESQSPINLRLRLLTEDKCPVCDASYLSSRSYAPSGEIDGK